MKTQDIKNMASAYMQVLEAEKKMDKVNPKALDKDFDDRKDKDIDNDGDVDKSDEYLHNRRKAVKKAMKDDEMSEAKSAAQQEDDDLDEISIDALKKNIKNAGNYKKVAKIHGADKLKRDLAMLRKGLVKESPEDNEVELDEASDKVSQIQNYLKSKGGSTTKVVKDGSATFTEIMPNNQKIIDSLKSRFQVQVVNHGPNKRALLVREEVEQVDELSRKTLGSYAKKAAADMKVQTGSGQRLKGIHGPSSKGSAELKKASKRQQGLNRAIDKLTKEEAELDEAAPKMQGDWLKKQRERDRAHNAAMGRTATGRKKPQRAMTSTQRSLASLRREETEELEEGAKEKALKALMTRALGGKRAKAGYTSAVATNGDFVVKDGGGRIVGRIKSGDYKDPLKESDLDEAMSKATRRALQSVKAQPKDKVSLKPAPWDKKKDTKNMSMKEKLQLQKEAILEREMTDAEMKKREDIVKGMKKDSEDMKKRYGSKWKDVMYATATKQAMESVDKALSMTKGLLTTKESFDTEDTKWPVYTKIKENRAMQTKGAAPGDPRMMDKMTASDKAFIDAHSANDLDGIDSGIDGAKAAEDTARNAAAQVKSGAGMNRTGDQKTGDKNIVKSTEAK